MRIPVRSSFWYLAIVAAGIALLARPVQADTITLTGILNASQVVDGGGSTSTATGFATVTIDTLLFTITTDLSWTGLSGPADRAHLHDAPAGQSRLTPPNDNFFHEVLDDTSVPPSAQVPCGFSPQGVINNCAPETGSALNVLQLSGPGDGYGFPDFASLLAAFERDGIYIDMHTGFYPSGEIRGQLAPVPEPASLALLGAGLLGLSALRRRRPT